MLIVSISPTVFSQIPDFLTAPRVDAIDNYNANGCDYLIITPNDPAIKEWADTLRNFREEQGIITTVLTMNEIGPNEPEALKAFLHSVYEQWAPYPAAVLLLGDYDSVPSRGITTFALTDHPEGQAYEPYLADNKLVDFNNNGLPDMVIARMPAASGGEARLMVQKTIHYERHPYNDEYYYAHPTTAMGFQQSRWFQLCTEIIAGYLENQGKEVTRINAIHFGVPDSIWSTGQRTEDVLAYFGPEGLNYIPACMSHLTDWSGNAEQITQALEDGTYFLIHRDHGTFEIWGEPYFSNNLINNLNNKLTFIMSANCQTGDFSFGGNYADCMAERFLRIPHGAVGIIAASQLSYSYVNDTYVWGFFDYLYPDFMPDYGPQQLDFQYPAFANSYGKYYLHQSTFPYNASMKTITNNLFHYFGDAYLQLYSDVPQTLTVNHPDRINPKDGQFTIQADAGSIVALSVDNQLFARKKSDGNDFLITLPEQYGEGTIIKVVATKQNHYRHESQIIITENIGIAESLCDNNIKVYPNPVDKLLYIECQNTNNIKIFNTLGQQIQNIYYSQDSDMTIIDCEHLNHGIYYIIITGGQNTVVRKFVKQ